MSPKSTKMTPARRWCQGVCAALTLFIITSDATGGIDLPPAAAPTDWPLTFHDEFSQLDLTRWDTAYPWGGRYLDQNEMQVYVDPRYQGTADHPLNLNPFIISDGHLIIRADRIRPDMATALQGRHYTSGLLTTARSFSQVYGYFEMRARFSSGRGLWPAFWLASLRSWPPEIDVVEILGHTPTTLHVTVHWAGPNNEPEKQAFAPTVADVTTGFHSYGVMWTPAFVAWYFDDQRVAYAATPPGMHQPMYLLVNLAVGGDWPGAPDADTKFPADMQVDYVRARAMP